MGVPSLLGQNAIYMEYQLHNVAQGPHRNDMDMPMRTIAALLTSDEIHNLAQEFAAGKTCVR
jgi:cytochrome c553